MSIALMVTTYGSAPMVHLNLEQAGREHVELLAVHDDFSEDQRLPAVADKYGATLFSTSRRLGSPKGDLAGTIKAMRWMLELRADYVVKVSRSFVPFGPMLSQIEYSMVSAGANMAYSNCAFFGMALRTECFALSAEACRRIIEPAEKLMETGWHGYLENALYEICLRTGVLTPAVGLSYLTGVSRLDKSVSRLWHDVSGPGDYAVLAKVLGLDYTEQDMARTE